ncbi:PREDICTED: thiosulfate sulfurtransferase/rhodanese-like domain-containing protein 1 [Nanorana parkeri]|uniref:thiosulfate sulfurtransferase/rhodanese-like domain-containing protein 1 n=1 Tax=Nanorana parkeri TaxID=125878 RepID=UPI000854A320|nr:PREDICTED: thiosulfate sulfurtransferase/rhodanese-like domain-containing protein 1 [Nanorana parkeri]
MFLRKLLTRLGVTTRLADNTTMSSGVISYDELKKLLSSGSIHLFDVRNPEELKSGKIPNAINMPVAEVEGALQMDADAFKKKYNVEKPKVDDGNLIFHCHLGRRGQRAADIAVGLGYKKARNYLGAYKEWAEKEGK